MNDINSNSAPKSVSQPSLLIDGSALYFGQRAVSPDRNMDYGLLLDILKKQKRSTSEFRPAFYFTASDQQNEKQAKFHERIEDLGLKIVEVPPHDAFVTNPLLGEGGNAKLTRFDSLLGYSLGRITAGAERPEIFVITDSFPVALPVRDAVERGASVTVAFFGSFIDTRWHKLFRESEAEKMSLHFFDLELFSQKLFQRARPNLGKRPGGMLMDLP